MNYELRQVAVPATPEQAKNFEAWLEKASQNGYELVSAIPGLVSGRVICIFRAQAKGLMGNFQDPY